LGVDSFYDEEDGQYHVYSHTGRPDRAQRVSRQTSDWVAEASDRGVGEVVLNVMNNDGVRKGYDIRHLAEIARTTRVPIIASGGAGSVEHFVDLFKKSDVSGALAASVFHSGEIEIGDLKLVLDEEGICVRK
jgi:cyclase